MAAHNARWVCTRRVSECDGYRIVRGRNEPCPLKRVCCDAWLFDFEDKWREALYEYPCTRFGDTIREISEHDDPPDRAKQRNKRREDIILAFWAEDIRAYRYEYNHRPEVIERRRIWERNRMTKTRLMAHKKAKQRYVLPCGEDCENCPYGECRYTDEEAEEIRAEIAVTAEKSRKHEKYAAHATEITAAKRDKYAADEDYREQYKTAERTRYARNKEDVCARQREKYATDPEYRAKALARYHKNKDAINARKRAARAAKKEATKNGNP